MTSDDSDTSIPPLDRRNAERLFPRFRGVS
jgi:hypothetical protein